MFIRIKTYANSPNRGVYVVRNDRRDGRVRQTIVRYFGMARDAGELERLRRLAQRHIAEFDVLGDPSVFLPEQRRRQLQEVLSGTVADSGAVAPIRVDLSQVREEERVIRGVHEVYGRVYDQLGLDRLLPARRYRASNRILRDIVMARLAQPLSKRASVGYLADNMGTRLNLAQVYRLMDHLDEARIDTLNRLALNEAGRILSPPLEMYLFDCTTLYFESFERDELKSPGYSKDAKFKESQVLLALMVTPEGLPVGYEVLPGQTFEGHSLRRVVARYRRQVPLRRAVVVADRGMLSQDNLKALRDHGIDYIVGARLRGLKRATQERILDREGYAAEDRAVTQACLTVPLGDDRLVVNWSAKRARRDAHDRQRHIDKLRRQCQRSRKPHAFLSNRGYAKYLKIDGDARVELNEDRIAAEARWDGLHGVRTSLAEADASATEVLNHYRGLWQVEQTFRVSKHDLRVRPIFHWTPRRIRAHLAIAFMALMCVRHLEYRCALQYRRLSPEAIRNSLVHMQQSILVDVTTQRRYVIPSKASVHAAALYRLVEAPLNEVPFELVD